MFRNLFRPYGRVWNFLNTITDAVGLSLCYLVCCLPLLTFGGATAALYDAAAHGIRNREGDTYRRFFRTLRREFKTGALVTLLWGAVLAFGFYVLSLLDWAGATDSRAAIMAGAYRMLLVLPMMVLLWSSVLLSRFTYGFRALTVTALRFLPGHPLQTLVLGIVTWFAGWYCIHYPIGLLFTPGALALGWTFVTEPIFTKYGGGLKSASENEE